MDSSTVVSATVNAVVTAAPAVTPVIAVAFIVNVISMVLWSVRKGLAEVGDVD